MQLVLEVRMLEELLEIVEFGESRVVLPVAANGAAEEQLHLQQSRIGLLIEIVVQIIHYRWSTSKQFLDLEGREVESFKHELELDVAVSSEGSLGFEERDCVVEGHREAAVPKHSVEKAAVLDWRRKLSLDLEVFLAFEEHNLPKLCRFRPQSKDQVEIVQCEELELFQPLDLPLIDVHHLILAFPRLTSLLLCCAFHRNIIQSLLELPLDGPGKNLSDDYLSDVGQSYLFVDAEKIAHIDAHFLQDALDRVTINKHQLKVVDFVDQKWNPVALDQSACLLYLCVLHSLSLHRKGRSHKGLGQQLAVLAFVVIAEEGYQLWPQSCQAILSIFLEVVIDGEDDFRVDEVVKVRKGDLILCLIFLEVVLEDLEPRPKRSQHFLLSIQIIRLALNIEDILNHIQRIFQFAHQLQIPLMRVQIVDLGLLQLAEGHIAHHQQLHSLVLDQ